MENLELVGEAIDRIGLTALAAKLGESIQTVSNWRTRGVPANRSARFEQATGISRKLLRPTDWQDFWPELAGTEGAPAVPEHAEANGCG